MPSMKTCAVVAVLLGAGFLLKGSIPLLSSVSTRQEGFVDVPWIEGAQREQVLIIGPPCSDTKQQMNALVTALASQNISSKITSEIQFARPEEKMTPAARAVFEGDVPIVFINGKAKSKPTSQEVIAEYQQTVAQRTK